MFWWRIAFDAWLMAVEGAAVVGLRSMASVAADASAQAKLNHAVSESELARQTWLMTVASGRGLKQPT